MIDSLPIRKFILAAPQDKVSSIMDYKFISISPYEDQEEAVKIIKKYNLVALPVVDREGVLLGIVTIDDIPVSYTHLDVYKRQDLGQAKLELF